MFVKLTGSFYVTWRLLMSYGAFWNNLALHKNITVYKNFCLDRKTCNRVGDLPK